jgi:hypothetical protein
MELSLLQGHFTIAANASCLALMEQGVFPHHVVISDPFAYEKLVSELEATDLRVTVTSVAIQGQRRIPNIVREVPMLGSLSSTLPFRADMQVVRATKTVVMDLGLPLAFFLGKKTVHLIGCDTNREGRFDGTKNKQFPARAIIDNYKLVRKWAEKNGKVILNAGINGSLDVFRRIPFEEATA